MISGLTRRTSSTPSSVLESTLKKRDEQIKSLQKEQEADKKKILLLQAELDDAKAAQENEIQLRETNDELHQRETTLLEDRINDIMKRDFDSEVILSKYGKILQSFYPSSPISSSMKGARSKIFADKLQTQLCMAMHKIEVLSEQVRIVKEADKITIDSLKSQLENYHREKMSSEANLTKQIRFLNNENRGLRLHLRLVDEEKRIEIDGLKRNVEELKQAALEAPSAPSVTDCDKSESEAGNKTSNKKSFGSSSSSLSSSSVETTRTMEIGDLSLSLQAAKNQLNLLATEKTRIERDLNDMKREKRDLVRLVDKVNSISPPPSLSSSSSSAGKDSEGFVERVVSDLTVMATNSGNNSRGGSKKDDFDQLIEILYMINSMSGRDMNATANSHNSLKMECCDVPINSFPRKKRFDDVYLRTVSSKYSMPNKKKPTSKSKIGMDRNKVSPAAA